MKRREVVALVGGAAAWRSAAIARAPKVPRIGYLTGSLANNPHPAEGFRQGLREVGYVDGRNILIEYRDFEGHYDRLSDLAADLVAVKVDAVMAAGTPHVSPRSHAGVAGADMTASTRSAQNQALRPTLVLADTF